jgi:acetoin utilization protein AcuB
MNHNPLVAPRSVAAPVPLTPALAHPERLVGAWMTTGVRVVPPETLVSEAHVLMVRLGIRRLPVVEHGRVVGIVTLGDLRQAQLSPATSLSGYELNYLLAQLSVGQVMTRHPLTVTPETPIRVAAGVLLARKIRGLPVVDSTGQPVGIITESDLFRALLTRWDDPAS